MARRAARRLIQIALLAAVYFTVAKLGLMLASVHPSATPLWPPTGVALAALIVLGHSVWPGIFVGALLANVTTAGSLATSAGVAAGNSLEAIVGAYLVNRFAGGRHAFDRPQTTFAFALLAGFTCTALSATLGVLSLWSSGLAARADLWPIWRTWWLGDAGGALILTPFLILWSSNPRLQWGPRRVLEAALVIAAVAGVGYLVFLRPGTALAFLCFPLLVWVAFRFGPRETATATILLSGIAVWGTVRGLGPFHAEPVNESLVLLDLFIGVMAVTALALAAAVSERRRLTRQVGEVRAQLKILRGLLPICAACKKIRNDRGYWENVETYISKHSEATFTHGICEECAKQLFPEDHEAL